MCPWHVVGAAVSALEICARCGWLEPGPDHDCILVERRVPRFSPLAIDPVPVDADDVPCPEMPSQEALLLAVARLAHERDEAVRQVRTMAEDHGATVGRLAIAEVRLEMAQRQVADLRLELKELRGSAAVLAESLGIRVN